MASKTITPRCISLLCIPIMVASPALADPADGHALECYEGAETIVTSDVADISEFDAASFGVTLQQTQSFPEHNAVIYHYAPRDIMCVEVEE